MACGTDYQAMYCWRFPWMASNGPINNRRPLPTRLPTCPTLSEPNRGEAALCHLCTSIGWHRLQHKLEGEAPADLHGSRPTLAKALACPLRGLAEEGGSRTLRIQCLGVTCQVSDIKGVDHLGKYAAPVALLECKLLGETEVLRNGRISQLIVGGHCHFGTVRRRAVVGRDGSRKRRLADARIQCADADSGKRLAAAGGDRARKHKTTNYRGFRRSRDIHRIDAQF